MTVSTIFMLGLLVIVVAAAAMLASLYNKLVSLKNRFTNAFAQIDVQLKRRHDLIPNLVETAKAYLKHERDTLEAVIAARNQASAAQQSASRDPGNAAALAGLGAAEGMLSGALGRLFAVVEQYPDLKADENMRQVHEELTSTENRIAFARQAFNDAVMRYNTKRESFPAVLIANAFGFRPAASWELDDEAARQAPQVSFS